MLWRKLWLRKRHYRHFYWEWQGDLDSGDSDLHFCVHWLHQRWLTCNSWYDSQHFFTQDRSLLHSKHLLPLSTLLQTKDTLQLLDSFRNHLLADLLLKASILANKIYTSSQDRALSFFSEHKVRKPNRTNRTQPI